MVSRKSLPLGTALCLLAALGLACGAVEPPPEELTPQEVLDRQLPVRPGMNVIVISFDALRPDYLGVYGHDAPTSPEIDAFAKKSLVFDQAYSAAPVTPTSFAAAFSGMLPTRVFHAWDFVAEKTLADYFSEVGYHTAAVVNSVQLTPERHFDKGFDEYLWSRNDPDEEAVGKALDWLYQNQNEPFFLWVHLLAPHAPYVYRPEAEHLYRADYRGPFETTSGVRFETDDPADLARIEDLYEGMVLYSDELFSELMTTVESLGLLETSMVVLTSDHGEEFYERGGFQHGRVNEEHIRVPLIVYHPDAPSGARTDVIASNVDLLPTLMAVTGNPITDPMDGHSVLTVPEEPRSIVAVSMTGAHDRYLSLRQEDQKLILTCMPERASELYDLNADPEETSDLAATEELSVRSLSRRLGRILGGEPCRTMRNAAQGKDATVGLSDETIESLRALGYL